jgi:hypothetical protein
MQDAPAVEVPQGRSASVIDEQALNPGAPSEPLEVQIANRAHEISQRGGGRPGQSLASWLEAAREVLSEDVESPQH